MNITITRSLFALYTLCYRVRLHISVIVLQSPHKATIRLEALSHHVINKAMLICDALSCKLVFVVSARVDLIAIYSSILSR